MTDLSDYQRKGDLWSPFNPTKNVERAHEQAQKLHDYVQEVVAKAPPIPPAREQIAALLRADTPTRVEAGSDEMAPTALLQRRGGGGREREVPGFGRGVRSPGAVSRLRTQAVGHRGRGADRTRRP